MKARLPVLSRRPEAPNRETPPQSEVERQPASRALVCVSDASAPDLAFGFAGRLLEALRTHGVAVAAFLVATHGRTRAGDARRIADAGLDAVFVLEESALPDAANAAFAGLPRECIVVGLGAALAARFVPLLNVRLSSTLPVMERGLADVDVELGPSMDATATLIGDWLATHVTAVSTSAAHAARE